MTSVKGYVSYARARIRRRNEELGYKFYVTDAMRMACDGMKPGNSYRDIYRAKDQKDPTEILARLEEHGVRAR